MTAPPPRAWLLHDGKAGNVSQLLGLGQALGAEHRLLRSTVDGPRMLLPARLWQAGLMRHPPGGDALGPPWPDIVIGAGRRTARAVLWVRRAAAGRPFAVQIQDSGVAPARFDLVTVPRHDRLRGPNVVVTDGAIHRVTRAALDAAAADWGPRLARMPRPRVAVLIGGSSRAYRMTVEAATALGRALTAMREATGGSLLVTASRRTGPEAAAALRAILAGPAIAFWDGRGDNPYLGYLALADAIVVTADSVSMPSEAAATGKPVHIADLPGGSPKFTRFHAHFRALGITRPFAGRLESWSYTPPDDAGRVAAEIVRRRALQ
ncbi:MAG: mitochondrial fission ELM1 family protein [Alphaproteobacteria bacterium]|nr:mitochondrial fission ELM1 family protein [Alphaproteobacteria bacterium]